MYLPDIKEIHDKLFDILCVFDNICKKKGFRYWLCGGTLLGAIRHEGFIPWDDDVDVFMPRKDYDELNDYIKHKPYVFDSKYKFVSLRNGNSNWAGARLMDLKTFNETIYLELEPHIFIDIFPIDGLPDNKKEADNILIRANKIKKLVELSACYVGTGKSNLKRIIKTPFALAAKIFSTKQYSQFLDKYAQRYDFNKTKYVGAIASSCGACERLKKEELLNTVYVNFNGKKFPAPSCWDSYLKGMYGDYMKIPEAKNRENHFKKVYFFD